MSVQRTEGFLHERMILREGGVRVGVGCRKVTDSCQPECLVLSVCLPNTGIKMRIRKRNMCREQAGQEMSSVSMWCVQAGATVAAYKKERMHECIYGAMKERKKRT